MTCSILPPSDLEQSLGGDTGRKARVAGLDILRAMAIVCVIGGHFFINVDLEHTPMDNPLMFPMAVLETFTHIGVPLFMMLTGYLNMNKTAISRRYFSGIWRVLVPYLVFSIITIAVRELYFGEHKSPALWVLDITSFSAICYAWYIEMWIGLFLLTPFLNRLWQALGSRRERLTLIGILFLCSSLPDFTNRNGFHLLPDYWMGTAYPMLMFYLGCYVKTYRPHFRNFTLLTAMAALCLINPVGNLIWFYGSPMVNLYGTPRGIVVIPLAACVFLLLYRRDIGNRLMKSLVTRMSLVSLEMYLAAYIFDRLVYPLWYEAAGGTQAELAPLYVPIVLSLVTATFVTGCVYNFVHNKVKAIWVWGRGVALTREPERA